MLLSASPANADDLTAGQPAAPPRTFRAPAVQLALEPEIVTHWYGLPTLVGLLLSDAALLAAFVAGDAGNTPLAVLFGIVGGAGHLGWPVMVHAAHDDYEGAKYAVIYPPLLTLAGMLAGTGACSPGGHPYRSCPPSNGVHWDTGRGVAVGAWAGAALGNIVDLAFMHLEKVPGNGQQQTALAPWVGPSTWGVQWRGRF